MRVYDVMSQRFKTIDDNKITQTGKVDKVTCVADWDLFPGDTQIVKSHFENIPRNGYGIGLKTLPLNYELVDFWSSQDKTVKVTDFDGFYSNIGLNAYYEDTYRVEVCFEITNNSGKHLYAQDNFFYFDNDGFEYVIYKI